MEIGMDFKSLVRSALLPLTTDFFPDAKSLSDYNFTEHIVVIYEDEAKKWVPHENPTVSEYENLLFEQLIRQRLQRGYQIVLLPRDLILSAIQ